MNGNSINDYQKKIDEIFKEVNTSYWQTLSILARLTEECGEVASAINTIHGNKRDSISETEEDIREELGDILFTLLCLANREGVDLEKSLNKSIQDFLESHEDNSDV